MAALGSFWGVASGAALSSAVALTPLAFAHGDDAGIALMPVRQAGCGGVSTPTVLFASHRWSDSGGNLSVNEVVPASNVAQLASIRRVLGASITDLAELFGVTRPTVYAWMQGAEPRGEHFERLQKIVCQMREVEAFGIAEVGKLLKRPLQDGSTLLELIKKDQPLGVALRELSDVAQAEDKQRSMSKGGKVAVTAADALSGQSMPGYTSEA